MEMSSEIHSLDQKLQERVTWEPTVPYTSRCVYTWMEDVGDSPARGHKPVSPVGDPGTGMVPITRVAGWSVPPLWPRAQPRAATKGLLLALEKAQGLAGDSGSLCHRECLCREPPPWHPHCQLKGDHIPAPADTWGCWQGWVWLPAPLSHPQGGGWCRDSPCSPVMGTGARPQIWPWSIATTSDSPKSRCVGGRQPHSHLPGVWSPLVPPSIQDQDFRTSSPGPPSLSPAYPAPRGARRGGGGCCCPWHPATWWLPVTGRLRAAWRAGGVQGPAACRRVPAGRGLRFKSKQR